MRRFLEGLVARHRETTDRWLDEARALRVVAADVAQYAAERLRDHRRGERTAPDPMEMLLDRLVLELAHGLVEAKRKVAFAIADEKRLAKLVDLERVEADAWTRHAADAARLGDETLTKEALRRRSGHEALATAYVSLWREQKASVDQLKAALHALYTQIENAKRDKNVVLARRRVARARETARIEMRRADEILRLVDRLSTLADAGEPDEAGRAADDRGPPN